MYSQTSLAYINYMNVLEYSKHIELLIYDFLGTENYKGISRKIIILLFYRVFQVFTLAQVGTGQIYYFREFINLTSINLKSFYCIGKIQTQ